MSVQFRDANLRLVFDGLSRSTSINFIFDREVRGDLKTTIFARDVSVEDAVDLILLPNQLEKKVLSENTVLVYPNTPAKQREYQDLVAKTFYLENADVKTTLNLVRTMLKTKDVFIDEKLNLLVMRDTPEVVRIAERLIAAHDRAEPEVVLELEVLEVDRTKLTELGVEWPDQVTFGVLDLSGGALTAEDLKNYLGRSATTTVSPSPSVTITAQERRHRQPALNPRIRVRNREKARVLVGDRLPVISAVITPSAVSPITTETVSYLDVGLKLDIEPQVPSRQPGRHPHQPRGEHREQPPHRQRHDRVRHRHAQREHGAAPRRRRDAGADGPIRDDDRRSADKVPGLGICRCSDGSFPATSTTARSEIILSVTPRVVRNVRRADARWPNSGRAPRPRSAPSRSR